MRLYVPGILYEYKFSIVTKKLEERSLIQGPFMTPDTLILVFAALLGAAVGSFLNVVILRLPQEGGSVVFPASHCPVCMAELHWYENIPVFSYLFLRGKCGHCKVKISLQYPLVELAMAVLSVCLFLKFGLTPAFGGYFLFTAALLVVIMIDLHHYIIPDTIDLPGAVLGVLFSFINPVVSWQSSLLGVVCGGGILWLVAWAYALLRKKEGMGGGDIKLLAMIGAWLGWECLPFVIFFSAFTGAVIGITTLYILKKDRSSQIPFGPFLSGSALIYMFFSEHIEHFLRLYLSGQWP